MHVFFFFFWLTDWRRSTLPQLNCRLWKTESQSPPLEVRHVRLCGQHGHVNDIQVLWSWRWTVRDDVNFICKPSCFYPLGLLFISRMHSFARTFLCPTLGTFHLVPEFRISYQSFWLGKPRVRSKIFAASICLIYQPEAQTKEIRNIRWNLGNVPLSSLTGLKLNYPTWIQLRAIQTPASFTYDSFFFSISKN